MIDLTPLLAIGLLIVRPGALLLGSPVFGGAFAPSQVKVALTVLIAVSLLPVARVPAADSTASMVLILGREMAIGVALGLAVQVFIGAAEMAGHLAGFQMGLSYSAIIDPASGVRNNAVASLYGMIATIVFLLTNAHHAFLRALMQSYEALPIGVGHISASLPQAVMGLLGLVFSFGLRLAAPLIVVMLIIELGLGIVTRAAPSLNAGMLGGPLKLLLGLMLVGWIAPSAVALFAGSLDTVLQLGVRFAGVFR